MNAGDAFVGLSCLDCGGRYDPETVGGRCPDCGGPLEAVCCPDELTVEAVDEGDGHLLERTGLDALLPVDVGDRHQLGRGETPLLDAPDLADEAGVAEVAVKAEGCNPTGSIADREMALAVPAARARGADHVALPTTGNAGQAAAAAAAGVDFVAHVFVPSRAPFVDKAMINVHGGDMTVVEGRYPDATAAFDSTRSSESWHSIAPFDEPFRVEGVKPVAYEIAAERGWIAPDRVVVPTGHVTALVGLFRGFRELRELGLLDDVPQLVGVQADGCPPLVEAFEADADEASTVERPDTVCGPLEVPDPPGDRLALQALAETDGTGVAVTDDALLRGATDLAEAGVPSSVTGGAAVAAVRTLATAGDLDLEEELVLVDPASPGKRADLLRSHLMSRGR